MGVITAVEVGKRGQDRTVPPGGGVKNLKQQGHQ